MTPRRSAVFTSLLLSLVSACRPGAAIPAEAESVKQQFGSYTVQRAASEGYVRDEFCLDAAALGQPAERGSMGFHATHASLLRGPIDVGRPQALMFDADGKILGVEYEVTADAVREAPRLFGRTFTKLGAHPGVEGEHYTLHFWFIENPSGPFDDFNPRVSCPPGTTPAAGGGHPAGHVGSVAPSPTPGLGRFGGAAATPTPVIVAGRAAVVEFRWGAMDPMMMEHDDGSMARDAQRLSGVVRAETSNDGIRIEYDPGRTDPARVRAGLLQVGLPVAD